MTSPKNTSKYSLVADIGSQEPEHKEPPGLRSTWSASAHTRNESRDVIVYQIQAVLEGLLIVSTLRKPSNRTGRVISHAQHRRQG